MKKLVKRKQREKKLTGTTQTPLMLLKNTNKKHPKKANPFEGQTGNTENYRSLQTEIGALQLWPHYGKLNHLYKLVPINHST